MLDFHNCKLNPGYKKTTGYCKQKCWFFNFFDSKSINTACSGYLSPYRKSGTVTITPRVLLLFNIEGLDFISKFPVSIRTFFTKSVFKIFNF